MDYQAKGRYISFLIFTYTLCFILVFTTVLLIINKLAIADYKEVIIVLGVPTIIGMAFNSFFHTNPNQDADPKDTTTATHQVTQTETVKSTEVAK